MFNMFGPLSSSNTNQNARHHRANNASHTNHTNFEQMIMSAKGSKRNHCHNHNGYHCSMKMNGYPSGSDSNLTRRGPVTTGHVPNPNTPMPVANCHVTSTNTPMPMNTPSNNAPMPNTHMPNPFANGHTSNPSAPPGSFANGHFPSIDTSPATTSPLPTLMNFLSNLFSTRADVFNASNHYEDLLYAHNASSSQNPSGAGR